MPSPTPPPATAEHHHPHDAHEDLHALLCLLRAGGASAPRRLLLERHPSPAAALRAGPAAWIASGLSPAQCTALTTPPASRALHWLECSDQHHLIGWHTPDYPPLLRQISSPPLALFIAGDPTLLLRPAIAVVGSRAASAAGCEHAARFARELAAAGLVVGSGLASGIDASAHHGALAHPGGLTYAVLGCGPDVAYPSSHGRLLSTVAQAGAVISEYPPGTTPRREYFPSRNRILAGLTLATVVIEAGARSGALITARLAGDAGREVFAVPGSIRNPLSRGCHRLIRDGAQLVEHTDDILDTLADRISQYAHLARQHLNAPGSGADGTPDPSPGPVPGTPDTATATVWQHLGHDPATMDDLVERTGLTTAELSSMLLVMELEGRVVVEYGRYSRTV